MDDITEMALIVIVVSVGGVFLYGTLTMGLLDRMYEEHSGEAPP